MHSDPAVTPLRDILYHIDLAIAFTADLDRSTFLGDLRTIFAVTRCLEIISEASRRLPPALKDEHPAIPWKRVAGAGNIYRHDYEDVAASEVWETLQRDLPPLRLIVENELSRRSALP